MRVLKIEKRDAERIKKRLSKMGLLEHKYRVYSDDDFVYFPINASNAEDLSALAHGAIIEAKPGKFRKSGMQDHYKSTSRIKGVSRSYDILGNIAVIEAGSATDAHNAAKAIMNTNKNVNTVVRKGSAVRGRFRKRKYVYVAGKRNFIADYRENGCEFIFDIRKTFFSSRLSFERKRIAEQVKDGETVMVMFAGVGPFAIEIAKVHRSSMVIAIELNANAHRAMEKNIELNKTPNVIAVKGDVNKIVRRFKGMADRIIMPLPKDSGKFLEAALYAAKERCIVHYYAFGNRHSAFEDSKKQILDFMKKRGVSTRFIHEREVRQYSPSEIEIVLDFILIK